MMTEKELRQLDFQLQLAGYARDEGNETRAESIERDVMQECSNEWFLDLLTGRNQDVWDGSKKVRVDL